MKIRKGVKEDLPAVLYLIKELALYVKQPEQVENSVEKMIEDGFGNKPVFDFFVAENEDEIVGLALYYYGYSTWKGKFLYLEDLVVTHSHRRKGVGKLLFEQVISKAREEDLYMVGWQVLDWNVEAINFYKGLGASFYKEWINCRLYKEQMEQLPLT